MAKSMLRQITQVSGSLAGAGYDDTLTLGVQATAESGANLQEDLNYIRSQIKNIIVKDNWYDLPRDITTVISGTATDDELATAQAIVEWVTAVSGAITSSDTFAGLEDTPSGYSKDEVIYYTASGTSSSANFTFDPDTNDFNVGASGTARLAIDSDSESTLYGDADTYITVSGSGAGFVEGGTLEFSVTDGGIMLNGGARVNDILNTADGDSIDASSTDAQLATAKLIYDELTTLSGVIDALDHDEDLNGLNGGDGTDYWHLDANTYNAFSSDGSTLTIVDDVIVDGTINVSGTLSFDGGTAVDDITTTITDPGDDTTLATEKAIVDYVDTISGSIQHNNLLGLQGGTASNAYYHLTANEYNQISAPSSTYWGVTNNFFVDGNADFEGNVNISGTLSFDAGTAVNDITTVITSPGDDTTLATEKAIVDYIDTVSGSIQHNELEGLQGGTSNEYYHLDANTYNAFSSDGTDLTVVDNIILDGDINVSGTLSFDGDQAVDLIDTVISGAGLDTSLVTEKAVVDYFDSESIWEIVDTPTDQIRPKIAYLQYGIYTEGNVTIGGDLTVTGTLFYADVETVQVQDNIMHINYGEVGAGVTAGEAGIQIDRGSETDYFFVFDEGTDTFRVGVSGTQAWFNAAELQPVATREDVPLDHRVTWWDDNYNTLRTQGDTYITVNSGTDTIDFAVNNTTEFSVVASGIDVKNSTSAVNEFLNTLDGDSISAISTDAQLATAKLIYNYVNALDHDEDLNGLNGGNGTDFWHVTANTFSGISSDGTTMTIYDTAADINGTLNVDGATTLMSTLDVTGNADFYANVNVSGTFGFDNDVNGSVNEILNSIDDTLDATSTDDQLATAKLIWTTISGQLDTKDEFIELDDTPAAYAGAAYNLLTVNGTPDEVVFQSELTYDGDTLDVNGNVSVSGTFGFGGQTVNEIVTTVTSGSTDDQSPTAAAVWNLMDLYDPHTHYEFDLAKGGGNDWSVDTGQTDVVASGIDVYLNGLLNRDDTDHYTAALVGTTLTVTYAYATYASDWAHVKFLIIDA